MPINWEESTTYQWILKKGIEQGLAQGEIKAAQAMLMIVRILDATTWADILATP